MMTGCTKQTNVIELDLNIPSALYYDEKIYWEVAEVNTMENLTYVGDVLQFMDMFILPNKNFTVSYDAKAFLNDKVYEKEGMLYVDDGEGYHQFAYFTNQQDMGNVDDEVERTEVMSFSNSNQRYVDYQGMRYYDTSYLTYQEHLQGFETVGKKYGNDGASQDFESNMEVGGMMYTSDVQNRYIIIKHHQSSALSGLANLYEYYENSAYRKQ